jgi:hypothetical protein
MDKAARKRNWIALGAKNVLHIRRSIDYSGSCNPGCIPSAGRDDPT